MLWRYWILDRIANTQSPAMGWKECELVQVAPLQSSVIDARMRASYRSDTHSYIYCLIQTVPHRQLLYVHAREINSLYSSKSKCKLSILTHFPRLLPWLGPLETMGNPWCVLPLGHKPSIIIYVVINVGVVWAVWTTTSHIVTFGLI